MHLLVRAAQNRMLEGDEKQFERCAAWSAMTHHTIRVPAKHGKVQRAERTAAVAARHGEVAVKRPRRPDDDLPETLSLRVVDVREVDPPADPDQRVHWCLLMTHAVGSTAEAMRTVAW